MHKVSASVDKSNGVPDNTRDSKSEMAVAMGKWVHNIMIE